MNRSLSLLLLAAAPAVVLVDSACGGSSSSTSPEDGGTSSSGSSSGAASSSSSSSSGGSSSGAGEDAGGSSSGSDGGSSSGSSGSVGEAGLEAGPPAEVTFVSGVTSDDQLIYYTQFSGDGGPYGYYGAVYAVPFDGPLDGGATRTVVPLGAGPAFEVAGSYVFNWVDDYAGAFEVWSSLTGMFTPLAPAPQPWTGEPAQLNGSEVLYLVGAFGKSQTLVVQNVDGTAATTLVPNPSATELVQPNDFGWAGQSVVASVALPPDAGVGRGAIQLFTGIPAAPTTMTLTETASSYWTVSSDGSLLYVPTAAGPGQTFSTATGAAGATIDTSASEGFFLGGSTSEVVYRSGTAIKKSAVVSPSPTTLVASGVQGLLGQSPNGATVAYNTMTSYASGVGRTDLWIAPTASASSGVQVLASAVGGDVGFTSDSSYVLFASSFDANGLPTFAAAPVTAKSASQAIPLGSGVLGVVSTGPAKLLVAANYSTVTYTFDLQSIDLSVASPSLLTVVNGITSYQLSNDRTKLDYVTASGSLETLAVP